MLTELQSLLTIVFLAVGSIGSIIYVAFSEGGQRQKNKQTANDLESADDAKTRAEKISVAGNAEYVERVRKSER